MDLVIFLAMGALKIAIPVLLLASADVLVQRSGVVNLSCEGAMLLGAFTAYYVVLSSGDPLAGLAGLASAALAGILYSLAFALAVSRGLDQLLAGFSMSLLSLGLTSYLYRLLVGAGAPPAIPAAGGLEIPLLVAALASPLASWAVLSRSSAGPAIRASGEDPERACRLGVRVSRLRAALVVVEGLAAGLAGASTSTVLYTGFLENMTAGRGYMAVALVILSGWSPLGVLPAVLLVSLAEALQLRLQAAGILWVPHQLANSIPYVVAVAALAAAGGRRRRAPRALASPSPC